ncbi:CARDB domain-containing protein [Haladaptatus sp. NG-WS-4]
MCVVLVTLATVTGLTAGGAPVQDSAAVESDVPVQETNDPAVGFVQQQNGTQGDQQNDTTFEPVQIEGETVSVDGVSFRVEQGLLTLRNGTLTLFVKRGAVVEGGASAAVTNARIVLGDDLTSVEARQIRRGLERGTIEISLPENVSHVRVALGLVSVEADGVVFRDTNVRTNVGEIRVPPGDAVAGPQEVPFEVSNISAPENVSVDQSFEVSVTVRNPGNRTGTEEVQYRFGGVVIQRQTVTLGPGESKTVTFQVSSGQTTGEPGTYDHGVYAFASNQTARISLTDDENRSVRP